jgi:predicted metal-dependent phosphoesterase TrpH
MPTTVAPRRFAPLLFSLAWALAVSGPVRAGDPGAVPLPARPCDPNSISLQQDPCVAELRANGLLPGVRLDFRGSAGPCRDALAEMNRLFPVLRDEDEPVLNRLGMKMLLAAPLLRKGNAAALLIRPPSDLYETYGKRLALRALGRLGRITPPPGFIALDLHVHTCFSHDSLADPDGQLQAAARRGLNGIAVVDHDTVEGGRVTQARARHLISRGRLPADFLVIAGEEIASSQGHIVGLFLTHTIAPGMTARETIAAIHQQGGVAVAVHPELGNDLRELAASLPFDAVETEDGMERLAFAQASAEAQRRRAAFYAGIRQPHVGGSDAHDPEAVGLCYTLLPCPSEAAAVRAALSSGETTPGTLLTENRPERKDLSGQFLDLGLKALSLLRGRPSLWMQQVTHADAASLTLWPDREASLSWSWRF